MKNRKCFLLSNLRFFLLGYPDSNQERQDQNLQCYHYTIPQFLFCGCKGTTFSETTKTFGEIFLKILKNSAIMCLNRIKTTIFAPYYINNY